MWFLKIHNFKKIVLNFAKIFPGLFGKFSLFSQFFFGKLSNPKQIYHYCNYERGGGISQIMVFMVVTLGSKSRQMQKILLQIRNFQVPN